MDAGNLKRSLRRRLRRPGLWLGALALGLLWVLVRFRLDAPLGGFGLGEVWLPGCALLVILFIAPLPWQWTGDARALAPAPRGLAQALPFNAAWIAILLAAFGTRNPPPRPPPPFPPPPGASQPPSPLSLDFLHGSLILLAALAAGRLLAQSEADALRAEAADALAAQARGQALQAQLHPHALFNALSGLTELVHEDPEAAEAALVTLSDFLRRLMRQGARGQAPLGEERALLLLQLRIAELRLGPRLQTDWDWPEWADAATAPPLLLQPLVENALRHGIAARTLGGRLRIRAAREAGALMLEVANTGELVEPSREGMGLGNLRERLALLDPPGRLELTQVGGWTRARVVIPERR
ncbi:MAG TPA: histidine kinase [Holophagaceae bacterium]|nr:histidine kinase [Holophagaceae bacterium]